MSNETLADVRTELFAAMRGLTDKANPMDIERARAVSDIAQVIINSAKVEVDHLKIAGGKGSGFIPSTPALPGAKPAALTDESGTTVVQERPGVRITQHKLKG